MLCNMPKGSKEADPRLNPGLYYSEAWALSTKPRRMELLIAPYSWTIYSSFGVTVFLCGAQRKVGYVDSRGSSVALEIFNEQKLGNSVLNITRQKPRRGKPNREQIRTAPEKTTHMGTGTHADWDSLSGMLRACTLPSAGHWAAPSPPSMTYALDLGDPMKLSPLSSLTNVKLFFLLLLRYVPFWRWKSWYTSYLAKAKGFVLKYIPYSSLQKFLSVHHVALLTIYFSCVVLSHR